jgi:hypothetical protein
VFGSRFLTSTTVIYLTLSLIPPSGLKKQRPQKDIADKIKRSAFHPMMCPEPPEVVRLSAM